MSNKQECKFCNTKKSKEAFYSYSKTKCKSCYQDYYKSKKGNHAHEVEDLNSIITCKDCNEDKKSTEFYRHYQNKSGRFSYCKTCYNKKNAEYKKNRRETDVLFDLLCRYRSRTSKAFNSKNWKNRGDYNDLLGTTWENLKSHIEKQFSDDMCWDNRSEWHIDHIVPLSSATNSKDLKALCHYTNLQPLWAEDNLSKGDKLDWIPN